MADYTGTKEFEGATFERASFRGARMRNADFSGVTMRATGLNGLDVDDHDLLFGSLIVNGVDVVPLVEAELNRRFPGRELQSATTPEGLREGWERVKAAWAETVESTPAALRDASVDEEWSLAQTLRHLVLATDAWLRKTAQGVEEPFHPIGLVFTGAERGGFDTSGFREAESWDEIVAVRAERQRMVDDLLAEATPEQLDEEREGPWGGDWKPTVGDSIRVILEEEWAHLRYIRRDLAKLAAAS